MNRSFLALTTIAAIVPSASAQLTEATFQPAGAIGSVKAFGLTVDLDGTRGVAGGIDATQPTPAPGRAYVFERQGTEWTVVTELVVPTPSHGYGRAVALSGDVAVIGDGGGFPETPEMATAVGAAHVFTFDGLAWTLTQTLQSGVTGDGFGQGVAIHGETIVVGAPEPVPGATAAAPAVVYRRVNGIWTKLQDLVGFGALAEDRFGDAVGVHDDLIVVGAPSEKQLAGAAYVFEEAAGTWNLTQKLTLGALTFGARFATTLAVHGERFLVGAPEWNMGIGAALLYEKQAFVGWTDVHLFQKPMGIAQVGDRFGTDVDLDHERVAIGTPGESWPLGAVYAAKEDGGNWPLHRILGDSGPINGHGTAVAVAGDRVATGEPLTTAQGLVQISFIGDTGEPLQSNTDELSVSVGGTQHLSLDLHAQPFAGDTFLILGSISGATPGIPLPNGGTLPLNFDPYFSFTFANPSAGLPAPGIGTLSGAGNAVSAVVVPAGVFPSAVGLTLHHAVVTLQPGTFEVTGATNAVDVKLVP